MSSDLTKAKLDKRLVNVRAEEVGLEPTRDAMP